LFALLPKSQPKYRRKIWLFFGQNPVAHLLLRKLLVKIDIGSKYNTDQFIANLSLAIDGDYNSDISTIL
jgi:hypothetical protein